MFLNFFRILRGRKPLVKTSELLVCIDRPLKGTTTHPGYLFKKDDERKELPKNGTLIPYGNIIIFISDVYLSSKDIYELLEDKCIRIAYVYVESDTGKKYFDNFFYL